MTKEEQCKEVVRLIVKAAQLTSQAKIARALQVDLSLISRIVRGQRNISRPQRYVAKLIENYREIELKSSDVSYLKRAVNGEGGVKTVTSIVIEHPVCLAMLLGPSAQEAGSGKSNSANEVSFAWKSSEGSALNGDDVVTRVREGRAAFGVVHEAVYERSAHKGVLIPLGYTSDLFVPTLLVHEETLSSVRGNGPLSLEDLSVAVSGRGGKVYLNFGSAGPEYGRWIASRTRSSTFAGMILDPVHLGHEDMIAGHWPEGPSMVIGWSPATLARIGPQVAADKRFVEVGQALIADPLHARELTENLGPLADFPRSGVLLTNHETFRKDPEGCAAAISGLADSIKTLRIGRLAPMHLKRVGDSLSAVITGRFDAGMAGLLSGEMLRTNPWFERC